jgi:hypothetical protein
MMADAEGQGLAGLSFTREGGDAGRAVVEARNAALATMADWSGECDFCKEKLIGTIAQLKAHRCKEYEDSLGEPGS